MTLHTNPEAPAPPGDRGDHSNDAAPPSLSRPSPLSMFLARLDLKASPYLYIAPFFILFSIFGLYPLVYSVWLSMTNESPMRMETDFVGLQNYIDLMSDSRFWNSVTVTLGIFVIATVPQLLMALAIANWLNRKMLAMGFFRMSIAIPIVTSTAVVALIFGMFFARDYGLVNWVLTSFGMEGVDWRASRYHSWIAIATMVDWRWTGYNALIYLAAMQAIPKDMYESAEIDGATRSRQFWAITIPLLKPTIIFTVIISTIGGLQLFVEPLMFTSGSGAINGGSTSQFQTMAMYLVQTMRSFNQWGYAGAISVMLILLTMTVSLINYLLIRRISSDK